MLKKIGAANWTEEYIFDPTKKFTKETASVNLQGCWNEVSKNHVKTAWATVLRNGEKISRWLRLKLRLYMIHQMNQVHPSHQNSSNKNLLNSTFF
jgi:hypothetical protein